MIVLSGSFCGGGGGGWWGVCKVIVVSNPTRLRLGCGWVVLWLGWGFDKNTSLVSSLVVLKIVPNDIGILGKFPKFSKIWMRNNSLISLRCFINGKTTFLENDYMFQTIWNTRNSVWDPNDNLNMDNFWKILNIWYTWIIHNKLPQQWGVHPTNWAPLSH